MIIHENIADSASEPYWRNGLVGCGVICLDFFHQLVRCSWAGLLSLMALEDSLLGEEWLLRDLHG